MVQVLTGAVLIKVDPLRVELEALLAGIDSHGHGAHGRYGLHQLLFITVGDVDETYVVGASVLRVEPVRSGFFSRSWSYLFDMMESRDRIRFYFGRKNSYHAQDLSEQ